MGEWAANSPELFGNTCAARLSKALNYSNFEIPAGTSGAYLGGDGKYYFINAQKMADYLSKNKVLDFYRIFFYWARRWSYCYVSPSAI